ncbi:MAG TPA: hypothetical protein VFD75_12060, partial [Pyrinomonadaceae bacterium]|nr:hypothetical protein [Pyrinomonadaceae bacterium]
MAIVGAITLARTGGLLTPRTAVVPGAQVFSRELLDRERYIDDLTPVATHSTEEAEELLGLENKDHNSKI